MKSSTKIYINRFINLILVATWMIIVFKFSNEPADTSQNTSLNITKKIVSLFTNDRVSEEKKEQIIDELDPKVRKLAHFTLYAIGGFFVVGFANTYKIEDKKKLVYSISMGAFYACTDEFHQLFVEGRSGQFIDVVIDSLGTATGVCIFLYAIKLIKCSKAKI